MTSEGDLWQRIARIATDYKEHMNKTALATVLAACFACAPPPSIAVPESFTQAAVVPVRPTDAAQPLAAVVWALNYDLRELAAVWTWLHSTVPAGPARSRAIAVATLIAVAELDRDDWTAEGLVAFDEAMAAYPDDARLPVWKGYIEFLDAREAKDAAATAAALDRLRAGSKTYAGFTLFGVTLGIGGWEDATPEMLEEGLTAFANVVLETGQLQAHTEGVWLERSRRLWDTPIAPYNIPAMQAMIGDLAARSGKKNEALRSYYTAMHTNSAARWPWRGEVQRRMENVDQVIEGFAKRPSTEWALGSQRKGSIGVPSKLTDTRFGGRIGNGSCTVCHSHVSVFDVGEPAAAVGWVKGRVKSNASVPNMQAIGFLLPDGENPIPGGFGIGPFVDSAAPRDFYAREELYDGTFVIPATPGRYFVALQTDLDGQKWQGYLPTAIGAQWFVDVKAGEMLDVTSVQIEMKPLKQQ